MRIGYYRVSTPEQDPQLQIDALERAGCGKRVYGDTASGARDDRPQLNRVFDILRAGDELVVWRLDRLGRSLRHLINTIESLREQGVGFVSLTEGFDTSTNGGRLIFNIFASLADFERELIRERTRAGLESARARGRKGGRPEKLSNNQIKTLKRMYDSRNHSVSEIAKTFDISRPSVYRYLSKNQ